VDKQTYNDYLKSPLWQILRRQALCRARNRCSVCKSEVDLHVHHKTYANVGNEQPNDLVVLCESCHTQEHDKPATDGQPLLREVHSAVRTLEMVQAWFEGNTRSVHRLSPENERGVL